MLRSIEQSRMRAESRLTDYPAFPVESQGSCGREPGGQAVLATAAAAVSAGPAKTLIFCGVTKTSMPFVIFRVR